jgi:outer membrane protein TolC
VLPKEKTIINRTRYLKWLILFCCGLISNSAFSQSGKVYLDSLLNTATRNYPLLKSKRLQIQSLQQAVKLQQNTLIPSVSASYQLDYATFNNITGMAYPQYITPISGPPSTSNNYNGTPGSAIALNLNWEPFTFGQRGSAIALAKGKLQSGQAEETLTIFQQKILVINAWLNYLLTANLVKVYQVNIGRNVYQLKQSQALVSSGLRPGTDSSTFHAELAKAQVQVLAIERQRDSCLIVLKEMVGGNLPGNLVADSSIFRNMPGSSAVAEGIEHPEIALQKSNVQANELLLKNYKTSLLPKLTVWSVGYGRGSGVGADGSVNNSDGLRFERYNYGIGAQISVPIFEVFRQKPLFKQQELNIAASREQLNQTELHLNAEQEIADSALLNAIQTARLSPEQLKAAKFAYEAIQSRYQSGLVSYYDVIQSLQLLYQSEANVKIAYWGAWKSLLTKAAYRGNIDIFLNQYGK